MPLVRQLAKLISRLTPGGPSLALAITGPWGSGKSSILNLLAAELGDEKPAPPIIIRFNPWHFNNTETLLAAFFREFGAGLPEGAADGTPVPKLRRALQGLGNLVSSAGTLVGVGALAVIGKILSTGAQMAQGAEELLPEPTLEKTHKDIAAELRRLDRLVVVLIDDLDRLDPPDLLAVLRLVRLTAAFSGTVFVLAFDDVRVARVLTQQYAGADYRVEDAKPPGQADEDPTDRLQERAAQTWPRSDEGRAYLEKIVQLLVPVPPVDRHVLRDAVLAGVGAVYRARRGVRFDADEFAAAYDAELRYVLRTLRDAKRFLNSLRLLVPLVRDEINPTDFALVEALRLFFPDVHRRVAVSPGLFVSYPDEWNRAEVTKTAQRNLLRWTYGFGPVPFRLCQMLFPALVGPSVLRGRGLHEGHVARRIHSWYHFDLYFNFACDRDLVSSRELRGVLRVSGQERLTKAIKAIVEDGRGWPLLLRLALEAKQLGQESCGRLARLLFDAERWTIELRVPEQAGPFASWLDLGKSGMVQDARHALLDALPSSGRGDILKDVLSSAQSAHAVYRWFIHRGSELARAARTDDIRTAVLEDPECVGLLLGWKQRAIEWLRTAQADPSTPGLLNGLVWWGEAEAVRAHIQVLLDAHRLWDAVGLVVVRHGTEHASYEVLSGILTATGLLAQVREAVSAARAQKQVPPDAEGAASILLSIGDDGKYPDPDVTIASIRQTPQTAPDNSNGTNPAVR